MALLDDLAVQLHCQYLSDLRFLAVEERRSLADVIGRIPYTAGSLWEWNDALDYLVGAAPEQTVEAAKRCLLAHLRFSKKSGKRRQINSIFR